MTQAEVKKLASEIIGDGETPNKWFVTTSPYIRYHVGDWEMGSKLLEDFSDKDIYTYGPFDSFEEAIDCYDENSLDADCGVGSVSIEDREIGTVREKWLVEKTVITYSEDEHDDSNFYSK